MSRACRFLVAVGVFGAGCLILPVAQSQPPGVREKLAAKLAAKAVPKPVPKLEPVAETKLLMEGLVNPNLRALGKLLRDKPKDAESWVFVRGQALLIAESGNLLLIRPPRTPSGEEPWMAYATELRDSAAALARAAGEKDYQKSRAALAGLANACNRCHQTFQIAVRVDPFADE